MNNSVRSRLLSFLVPVVFFLSVLWISNFPKVFQYDPDEGVSVMASSLYNKGYVLYKDIWLDQPPFFVLLLSSLFKLFGPSVPIARGLVLVFSSLLLWALFRMISKTQNVWAALFAVCALVFSSNYVLFSVAVMRGLPAVALAVLACHGVWCYQTNGKKRYLVLSACFFAMALMTKLFVIYFLPALLGQLLLGKEGELLRVRVRAAVWWSVICAVVSLIGFFIITSANFSQLLLPHILLRKMKAHVLFPGYPVLKSWFSHEYGILLVVLGTFLATTPKERRFSLIPCVCLIAGILMISVHYKVWSSYRVLVFLPLCWLASFGVYKITRWETWEKLKSDIKARSIKVREVLALLFLLFTVVLFVVQMPLVQFPGLIKGLSEAGEPLANYQKLIDLMKQYDRQVLPQGSHMVVTDCPIIPFYADLIVPPFLAAPTITRFKAKMLSIKDFIRVIRQEKPSMVLLGRDTMLFWGQPGKTHMYFNIQKRVSRVIKEDYILEYRNPNLYVAKDIDISN